MEVLRHLSAGTARLVWRDRDPSALTGELRDNGFRLRRLERDSADELRLGRLTLVIGRATRPADEGFRLDARTGGRAEARFAQLPSNAHPNGVIGVAAVALATVDAERAMTDSSTLTWQRAGDEPYLGAWAWTAQPGALPLLLLEPATEGRLAAALARMGEGPVALYLRRAAAVPAGQPPAAGEPYPWPLGGAARPISPRRPWGPFLLLVEADREATSAPGERARPADGGRPRDGVG